MVQGVEGLGMSGMVEATEEARAVEMTRKREQRPSVGYEPFGSSLLESMTTISGADDTG